MTALEALDFVTQLHDFIERNVQNRGNWCWPTRDVLNENLTANRENFPRDSYLVNSFNRVLRDVLLAKGWVEIGGCSGHCHAEHVQVTAEGREALRQMKQRGCESGEHIEQKAQVFKFQKKAPTRRVA